MADEYSRPAPGINYAAQLAELRRKQKEAMSRDDWAEVDRIEQRVRDLEAKADEIRRKGGK